jgi:DNA-binding response OmpR family regulator
MAGVLHICVASPAGTAHHALLGALTLRHQVSVVAPQQLADGAVLQRIDLLVLDAEGIRATLPWLLRMLRRRRPDLKIVLIDGGLSEQDKADAFTLGVVDYFPASCAVGLLVERLEALGRTRAVAASS